MTVYPIDWVPYYNTYWHSTGISRLLTLYVLRGLILMITRVCVSAHISHKLHQIFTMDVVCGRDSVLFLRRRNTLYIIGVVE